MAATSIRKHKPTTQADGASVVTGTPLHNFSRLLSSDVGTGASFTYQTDDGDKLYQLSQGGAGTIAFYDTWTGAVDDFSFEAEIELDNTPSTTANIIQTFADDAYGPPAVNLNVQLTAGSPAARIRARNQATGIDTTSTVGLAPGSEVLVRGRYQASAQAFIVKAHLTGQAAELLSVTSSVPTATVINSIRAGILTASTGLGYKLRRFDIASGDWITRTDIAAPTATISRGHQERQMYQAGSTVPLQWSAAISGDTIASATITWQLKPDGAADPAISGSPSGIGTANVSVNSTAVLGSVGYYRALLTVTPNGGGAATTSTLAFGIYPAPKTPTIVQEVILDGATVFGGPPNTAAGAKTALTDGDLATGLEFLLSSASTARIRFGPVGPTGLDYKAVHDLVGGGSYGRKFTWMTDDGTVIFSYTRSGITAQTSETYSFPQDALTAIAAAGPNDIKRYGLMVDIENLAA